jgi:regulator of sirC expression with transglutaminase-like and TPR domain
MVQWPAVSGPTRALEEGRTAVRIRELWSLEDRLAEESLHECMARGDLIGALSASQFADEPTTALVRAHVDRWTQQVSDLPERTRQNEPAEALRTILVGRARLRGAVEDYHALSNTRLSDVVIHRRGMPILLSCLWIAVGTGAGLAVEGLGLPYHFLVRVGGVVGEIVDPFMQGRPMTVDQCRRMVANASEGRLQWDDAWLEAVTHGEILRRCLRNTERSAQAANDHDAAYRATRLLHGLDPEEADLLYQLAHHASRAGAQEEARAWCHAIIRRHGGTPLAMRASGLLKRTTDPVRN